jgi:hypothetical protein
MAKFTPDEKPAEQAPQWANLIGELFDRLTGKGAEIAYNFQNLEIDIPKAVGPSNQKHLAAADKESYRKTGHGNTVCIS